jgi:hypothetical protein
MAPTGGLMAPLAALLVPLRLHDQAAKLLLRRFRGARSVLKIPVSAVQFRPGTQILGDDGAISSLVARLTLPQRRYLNVERKQGAAAKLRGRTSRAGTAGAEQHTRHVRPVVLEEGARSA